MESKFVNSLVWAVIVLALLGVIWLILEPIIWWTPYSELRICVRVFLIMFAISTFAQLRLYNSIVQNTRFSFHLREAFVKFMQTVPALERAMKNLNSTLGNVKASSDNLKKEISILSDRVVEKSK